MRVLHRVATVIAGCALAVAGAGVLAPAAQADAQDCVGYLEEVGHQGDEINMACQTGAAGDVHYCMETLIGNGVRPDHALMACARATA